MVLWACIGCSEDAVEQPAPVEEDTNTSKKFVEYVIPKGSHFSIREDSIVWINTSELVFEVIFDSSAIYSTINPNNQGDINKLYGFSDNNDYHQTNSARFGWRWYNKQLQLHTYVYNEEKRSSQLIRSIPFNQPLKCAILVKDKKYLFAIEKDTVVMKRSSQQSSAVGYRLFPYFGGDEPAPHEIKIKVKEL